jgi:hypothetical protein
VATLTDVCLGPIVRAKSCFFLRTIATIPWGLFLLPDHAAVPVDMTGAERLFLAT